MSEETHEEKMAALAKRAVELARTSPPLRGFAAADAAFVATRMLIITVGAYRGKYLYHKKVGNIDGDPHDMAELERISKEALEDQRKLELDAMNMELSEAMAKKYMPIRDRLFEGHNLVDFKK